MTGRADPGTELEFEGVISGFSKDPFMLTMDIAETADQISGWPAPAPAAKKAAAKKAATKKAADGAAPAPAAKKAAPKKK